MLALFDVLVDRERKPVVVVGTLVHPLVELLDLLFKELLLYWLEMAESKVITS